MPRDLSGVDVRVRPIPGAAGVREELECLVTILVDPDPIASTPKTLPIDRLEHLSPVHRYLVYEFVENYQCGLMSRRELLSRVVHIAGGRAAGLAILAALRVSAEETYAKGSPPTARKSLQASEPLSPLSVAEDHPRVVGAEITVHSGDVTIMAYEARPAAVMAVTPVAGGEATPAGDGRTAHVLACHENRGLTNHIRDVTRRLAVTGCTACALDLPSREGGTANISNPSTIPGILTDGDINRHVLEFQAAIASYDNDSDVDASRAGMIGFCLGGGIAWRVATKTPELLAAIPFYGPPPPLEDVPNIAAAVLGVYSDDPSDGANEGRDEVAEALMEAGVWDDLRV